MCEKTHARFVSCLSYKCLCLSRQKRHFLLSAYPPSLRFPTVQIPYIFHVSYKLYPNSRSFCYCFYIIQTVRS